MTIEAPQIIWIVLIALNFGLVIAKHGEPRTGKVSAWDTLVNLAVIVPLLWWGGFFG